MADSTKKGSGTRKPRAPRQKKDDVAAAVEEAVNEAKSVLVEPLNPQAFQMAMQIIDRSDFKGADMASVLNLRRELARVARMDQAPGPRG